MLLNDGLINSGPINGDGTASVVEEGPPIAGGARLLQFGALKLRFGQDMALTPPGADLLKWGLHTAAASPILPSSMATVAGGVYLLELGAPIFAPPQAGTEAGGADILKLGSHAVGAVLSAGAAELLELGTPGPVIYATTAGSGYLLDLGLHSVGMAFEVQGMALLRCGQHTASIGGMSTQAGGVELLELGSQGPLGHISIARSASLVKLGCPSISRGDTC